MSKHKCINILGVTGSIGRSTQQVVLEQPEKFDVCVVSANSNVRKLAEQAIALNARVAVIAKAELLADLKKLLSGTSVLASSDLSGAIAAQDVDVTVAAIVGMAGLPSLMTAIAHSKAVAIANKEPLVAAGEIVKIAAKEHNCMLLPVDSEHNAVYQVFDFQQKHNIERIVLTASGGSFRGWSRSDMAAATVDQALNHPTWDDMGRKITIDSASMMNKALEVIEACILFDLPPEKVDVLIHPQSLVHGMVEYNDGSVLCQMGASDMCTPIASILHGDGQRLNTPGKRLSIEALSQGLSFSAADHDVYPALAFAYSALNMGLHACIALNSANEVSVNCFLNGQIGFLDILKINEFVMNDAPMCEFSNIDEIINYDKARRGDAKRYIDRLNVSPVLEG